MTPQFKGTFEGGGGHVYAMDHHNEQKIQHNLRVNTFSNFLFIIEPLLPSDVLS